MRVKHLVSVEERNGQVVADHDREEDGVEAVEDAAVGAEEAAGVLPAQVALQHRLEEIPDAGRPPPRQRR